MKMSNEFAETPDIVELRTNDSTKIVRLAHIQKFHDGSGYRCELTIVSGGFSCVRPFYFDDDSLVDALAKLDEMDAGRPESTTIRCRWEEEFLQIGSNDMGHVFVSGEIIEYSERPQRLKFAFQTDQTVLGPLIRDLQALKERPVDATSNG